MKMFTLVTVITTAASVGIASAAAPGGGQGRGPRGGGDRVGEARAGQRDRSDQQRQGRGDRAAGRDLTPEQRIDKREANQVRRIEQGVQRGQLTPEETAKLRGIEDNILAMESQFKSDGSLSREEARKMGRALKEASLQIWAERHDSDGKQKPVIRLGKNIFALDALTERIESGAMTRAEARKFLGDFRKMANLKRRLSSDTLTVEQRTRLQAEFNELLDTYFLVRA
jgi:hypothetical protein